MKPIKATIQDTDALIELGRASVQIVHDLKNQVNGLKLYATFLRRRLEKAERPPDELETIEKMMAGLDRAVSDMNTLVRFGRPFELQRQPGLDLKQLLASATDGDAFDAQDGAYLGEFDPATLSDALKNIHAGARLHAADGGLKSINLRREESAGATTTHALLEWRGLKDAGDANLLDAFNSGTGLRLALAAKIIKAHGGTVEQETNTLRVRLPLTS
jgi:signal transduction histidine kinase